MNRVKKKFETPFCEECGSRDHSIFCSLAGTDLERLSMEKTCNMYRDGQFIFNEGNSAAGLYCLHTGKVKLYKLGGDGNEQIVRLVKESDILGYRSLISGEAYGASAVALEECIICFIPKKTFMDLLTTKGEIAKRVMELLSSDLKSAEDKLMGIAHKPVRERLAEVLFMLKEFFGTEEGIKEDGQTINISLTREEIANIIGTATETAIRILSEFKKEGLIEINGKKIKMLQPEKLLRIADLQD